jgi:phosphoenolpyruvate phosphomutase
MRNEKAAKLRQMLADKELICGVGAGTALDAKLIERAGFDFVWSSSLCISAINAVPDASLLSMSQFLEAARSMSNVVDIPVIADCDTGYGNANNVIYATRLFDRAGIAAISIEDKKFPKDNSLLEGGRQELASIDEFSGKIAAATENRLNDAFMVIARVEALIAGHGQEEALKRARCYADAGADCIFIHSKSDSPQEIVDFAQAWSDHPIPLLLVPTTYPSLSRSDILALGNVKIIIYANHPLRASVRAIEEVLNEIMEVSGIHTIEDSIVSLTHIFELQGVPEMKKNELRYLLGD